MLEPETARDDPFGVGRETFALETIAKGGPVTCRRAQEIDLLEFLNAPQRADFENFRQHYPRCPDCSAELRTWTELHETLNDGGSAPAHPDPEELEQFDPRPGHAARACSGNYRGPPRGLRRLP